MKLGALTIAIAAAQAAQNAARCHCCNGNLSAGDLPFAFAFVGALVAAGLFIGWLVTR